MAEKKLNLIYKKTSDLIPYENNPRLNDEAVEYVANSISAFGFKVPIVITSDNVIVAGHTRLKACEKLGIMEVPCVIADDMTEEEIRAFRLADNKVGEIATWDFPKLDEELGNLSFDMSIFGFDDMEIEDEENGEKKTKEKGEVEFTEVLLEEHNYIVLYFDNSVDWLQAETLFGLKSVMALSTRKDEQIGKNMKRVGLGRVVNGAKALESLRQNYENIG